MAILTVAHSTGMMAGALIAGLTMDLISLRVVFPMGSAMMLGCTLAFFFGFSPRTEAKAESN